MPAAANDAAEAQALMSALHALLRPLARLAVGRGLVARDVEELLRIAFVAAAREVQPGHAPTRQVSRIATATGLTRREVTRLLQIKEAPSVPRRSPATELFARWLSDPALRDRKGRPRSLPRQGDGLTFETLAHGVTRDVHPRSLLDELCRLGLASVSADGESVSLIEHRFVPRDDQPRLLGLLGANVGDHLQAAVINVLGAEPRHLEQAVFADGLSEQSLEALRELVREQWQTLVTALVPAIQKLIEDDRAAGRLQTKRARVGLYSYGVDMAPPPAASPGPERRLGRARKKAAPEDDDA